MANKAHTDLIVNNLERFVLLKQAEMIKEEKQNVPLKRVYEDMAKHCGVTPQTIAMIKSGLHKPSLPVALKMAEYFNVDVSELFQFEEKEEGAKQE